MLSHNNVTEIRLDQVYLPEALDNLRSLYQLYGLRDQHWEKYV